MARIRFLGYRDMGREVREVVAVECCHLLQLGWPSIANAPSEMEEGVL